MNGSLAKYIELKHFIDIRYPFMSSACERIHFNSMVTRENLAMIQLSAIT
ncbi:Uncharacterised protein [Yersinia similis]|uniref:Uncharacterized protein n=1 Tax=Yersinia similis TaxID=367190 RepID=A0A0T9QS01_9GAMM|nr:Uncharacterised protein [Yersinia similis]CNB45120.1 Uncharacterised protein [Yersinia similis]CNF07643.1 Uncharacterised protein [Yersinia similis]CNF40453.1 Uncharacterised protein [Yersinia similis]CNI24549.1 Uncharacterised protein [Yersinia similis]